MKQTYLEIVLQSWLREDSAAQDPPFFLKAGKLTDYPN